MRNVFGVLAVFLIIIGSLFLLYVGLGGLMSFGMMSEPMPMMGTGSSLFEWFKPFVIVLVFILLVLIAYFAGKGRRQKPRACPHCGRKVEPDWRICPYCGHPQS